MYDIYVDKNIMRLKICWIENVKIEFLNGKLCLGLFDRYYSLNAIRCYLYE